MTPEELEEQRRQEALTEALDRSAAIEKATAEDDTTELNAKEQALEDILRESGPALEAETAQAQRSRGVVSEVGDFVSDVITGDIYHNISSSLFPETFKSADELKEEQRLRVETRAAEGSLYDKAAAQGERNLEAVSSGMLALPMLPFSAAATVTGQEAEWNVAPEIVKDNFASKAIYDVTKVAFPSLFAVPLLGGAATTTLGALGLPKAASVGISTGVALGTESFVETVANQDPDDYILSRTAAKSVGDLVNMMQWGDGTEVTRRLIEGDGIQYRMAGFVAGFFHNLGLNIGVTKLFNKIGKVIDPDIDKLAKASGKSPEEVEQIIKNTAEPAYDVTREPIESGTVDGVANVVSGDVKDGVSSMGFLQAIIRRTDDAGKRPYFLHLKGLTGGDMGFVNSINVLTKNLKRFPDIDYVRAEASITGLNFLIDNAELFPGPTKDFLLDVGEKLLRGADLSKIKSGESKAITQEMLKGAAVLPEGVIVGGVAMKELNQRAIDLARTVVTHDQAGIDWKESLPVLRQLIEANETWANIYRHYQQSWNVGGVNLQNKFRNALMTGTGLDKFFKKGQGDIYGKPQDMFEMAEGYVNANKHVTNVIDQAIEGDEAALKDVKDLLSVMATENAERPMAISTLTSDKLRANFYNRQGGDIGTYYYGQSLLGNLAVGTAATWATLLRGLIQPGVATIGTFPTLLQTAPRRALQMESYVDHLSLYQGGAKMMGQAMRVWRRSFATNQPIMQGTTRYNDTIKNLGQQAAERKIQFNAYMRQLDVDGKLNSPEALAAVTSFVIRTIVTSPFLHGTTRILMASDEAFKTLAGGSWAQFKAYRRALESGKKLNGAEVKELFDDELLAVFNNGDPMQGFVMGSEAADFAKAYTFQRDIPRAQVKNADGEMVDAPLISLGFNDPKERGFNLGSLTANTMGGLEDFAKKNIIFRWISPFSRMAYEFSNQGATQMIGTIPGGTFMSKLDPGVRSALRGDQGEATKLMMESNLAAGMGVFMSFASLSWMGMVQLTTATNKFGEQSNALVINTPDGGGVEINIEKLDPISFPLGILASVTNSYRDGLISEGRYQEAVIEIFADASKLFLEKGVLLGLTDFVTLLDSRNYNQGWATAFGNLMGTLTGSGTLRMARDWYDPYRRSITIKDKPFANFMSAWARRLGTDIFFAPPPLTNPYTGETMMKNVTPADANWGERIGAGMLQTLAGFRITSRTNNDPIIEKVQKWSYDINPRYYQQAPGADPFETDKQQAIYSADLYNPEYGNLRGRLKFLFEKDPQYKQLVKLYNRARKTETQAIGPLPAPEGPRAKQYREDIKGLISDVHTQAGKAAIEKGRLSDWYNEHRREKLELQGPMSSATGETDGLYAQAAQQDTQLASQVRDLLNIPV